MAQGPYLNPITAGAALIADTVAQNFTAIQNFLASIPVDNLNKSYTALPLHGHLSDDLAAASTTYFGHQKVDAGAAATGLRVDAAITTSANPLGGGETVVVTAQKTTPAVGGAPQSTDTWSDLGSVTFNATNTANAYILASETRRFAQQATLSGTVADGDWIRFRVVSTTAAITLSFIDATLHCKARIRS